MKTSLLEATEEPGTLHADVDNVPQTGFLHEAFMYAGLEEFIARVSAFIRDGIEKAEPTLVVVSAPKIELLRDELGPDAGSVQFADTADVGTNPARIIPVWSEFVSDHARSPYRLRGVCEPITTDRNTDVVVECHRHEALLNLAFADSDAFHLLCLYDTAALGPGVIAEARCTHPFVGAGGVTSPSADYAGIELASSPFAAALSTPPADADKLTFDANTMDVVRGLVMRRATAAGLGERRAEDIVLAVNEMATNSVRHGGGSGTLLIWQDAAELLCEVHDSGQIQEPLVGRIRPAVGQIGGFGVWLANQVCDLVQIRSAPAGTAVRLHMRRG